MDALYNVKEWVLDRYYEFPAWFRGVSLVCVGYGIHCIWHYVL